MLALPLAAQLPPLIELEVPPGTEAAPVLRVYGDDYNDLFGSNVTSRGLALGDVDGDGFDDLVVGAPLAWGPGSFQGAVYVVYGASDLPQQPQSSINLDTGDAISPAGETRIIDGGGGGYLGQSVSSGDVDGDGLADVIVGSPFASRPGPGATGEVRVVLGDPSLPASTFNIATAEATRMVRILGDDGPNPLFGDLFGYTVASGDLNGDGFADVVAGAPWANPPGGGDAGEVTVIWGGPSLPGSVIDLDTDGAILHGETRVLGDDASGELGASLACGDVNGDGFEDLIAGARIAQTPAGIGTGVVHVIYGGPDLPGALIDLDTDGAVASDETRILGDDAFDIFGEGVAAGDVDGDGFDDVIVGAPLHDSGGMYANGMAVVVYGSDSLPGTIIDLDTEDVILNGETRIYGGTSVNYGEMGRAVGASDIDGDGLWDVIIGASQTGSNTSDEVRVVCGSPSLRATAISFSSQPPDLLLRGQQPADELGGVNDSDGDLDRDGFADFAASAIHGDNIFIGPGSMTGYAVAIFGDGAAPSATVRRFTRVGDGASPETVPPTDFGPVVRCVVDFTDDDMADNGSGGASLTAVRLTRSDAGISNLRSLDLQHVADVAWEITTDRVGWNHAELTLQYTDAEAVSLPEEHLRLYQAPTPSGPWHAVFPQSLDTDRNEIRGTVTTLSHFAIVGEPVLPAQNWEVYR